jgi:hypothetical protein
MARSIAVPGSFRRFAALFNSSLLSALAEQRRSAMHWRSEPADVDIPLYW